MYKEFRLVFISNSIANSFMSSCQPLLSLMGFFFFFFLLHSLWLLFSQSGSESLNHKDVCCEVLHMPDLFSRLVVSSVAPGVALASLLAGGVGPGSSGFPDGVLHPRSEHTHRYDPLLDRPRLPFGVLQLNVARLQSQNGDVSLVPNLKFPQRSSRWIKPQQIHPFKTKL